MPKRQTAAAPAMSVRSGEFEFEIPTRVPPYPRNTLRHRSDVDRARPSAAELFVTCRCRRRCHAPARKEKKKIRRRRANLTTMTMTTTPLLSSVLCACRHYEHDSKTFASWGLDFVKMVRPLYMSDHFTKYAESR
jgi:hypothetical protein